ncbi:PREDICTED: zinc finger CCCH domain-containing protein 2-like [Ipomoea nil]|uniref:zinc finger CCCH domain-containing protein 2-like n=1 Tax=Ipomoea nil TaxID=35883 RepID=UPI000900DC9E|nr:PREDICTED: zinc finger CCCH domain-containing protein 2-like [Ipomoea nil]
MGSDNCGEHLHKFHPSHQLFFNRKYLRDPEIPPRKLLSRRPSGEPEMPHMESPTKMQQEDTQFQKFLPYNNSDDDDDDPYSSDNFRMFEFKVRRCTRSRSHDWTDCPFAHPGEKARRRDPRKYHYSGTVCAEFRKGSCVRGDNCEFAHGVFECWLHPTRYRTEACKDGKNCKRKVCFFAHTPRQLRVLPPDCHDNNNSPINMNHCCACCHSPNSTLMAISHMSPPASPSLPSPATKVPFSRFGGPEMDNQFEHNPNSMTELVSSLESMNLNGTNTAAYSHHHPTVNLINMKIPAMVDLNFNNPSDDQPQFILSPSTPSPSKILTAAGATTKYYNDSGLPGIDLGWVNDLLT